MKQGTVFGLAISLILVSLWRRGELAGFWHGVTTGQASQLKGPLLVMGRDVLFLVVALWLADLSPDATKMVIALLIALWLLLLFNWNNVGSETGFGAK
jgi:hypothetical protein